LQGKITAKLICSCDDGEWDREPYPKLKDAIEAAEKKSTHYHCRSVYYAHKKETR